MATRITEEEATRDVANVLARAAGGESFVIESNGKPLARLSPPGDASERRARSLALLKMFDPATHVPDAELADAWEAARRSQNGPTPEAR